jgi:hypothetical protein
MIRSTNAVGPPVADKLARPSFRPLIHLNASDAGGDALVASAVSRASSNDGAARPRDCAR